MVQINQIMFDELAFDSNLLCKLFERLLPKAIEYTLKCLSTPITETNINSQYSRLLLTTNINDSIDMTFFDVIVDSPLKKLWLPVLNQYNMVAENINNKTTMVYYKSGKIVAIYTFTIITQLQEIIW